MRPWSTGLPEHAARIKEQHVEVEDGRIVAYRASVLVTFVVDDQAGPPPASVPIA
jgi:hypothetical protein